MAVKRILRVFPTRTSYTPTDELAFCVPPHGDLIDRGVLAAEFWDGQAYFTDAIKRKINGATTVIPADMEADT